MGLNNVSYNLRGRARPTELKCLPWHPSSPWRALSEPPLRAQPPSRELWTKLRPDEDTVPGRAGWPRAHARAGELGWSAPRGPFCGKQPSLQTPVSPFVLSMAGIQKHVFLEPPVTLTGLSFLIKWKRYLTLKVQSMNLLWGPSGEVLSRWKGTEKEDESCLPEAAGVTSSIPRAQQPGQGDPDLRWLPRGWKQQVYMEERMSVSDTPQYERPQSWPLSSPPWSPVTC